MLDFDKVLGLGFAKIKPEKIPGKVLELVARRREARKAKDWGKSDKLRDKIKKLGYEIEDTGNMFKISKIK